MSTIRMTNWLVVTLLTFTLIGCAIDDEAADELETSDTEQALSGADGNVYVNFHRDRLLTGYAADHGLASAATAWAGFTYDQKLMFLIHTDLLGNRTFMSAVPNYYYKNFTDACGTANELCGTCSIFGGQRACGSCSIQGEYGYCESVSAYDCYLQGQCFEQVDNRTEWSQALEHVTRLYDILPGYSTCSGEDKNRSFFSADEQLINAFRNRYMPEWVGNGDIGSVHAPFNNRSETNTGRPFSCDGPDGQVQFFSYDWQGVGFARGGKYFPPDGRMFELDNDYNTTHDSNPTCSYCGGQYGLSMYESHWRYKGNAAPFDWTWAPTAPQPPQITGEQLTAAPYTFSTASLDSYISITGTNFCANPQVYIGGVYEYAYLAGANQISAYVYGHTPVGGQYAYVICNGVWSNAWYVNVTQPAPPFSCSLTGPGAIYAGQYGYWSGTSTPAGYYAYWFGTKDGGWDVYGSFAGTTSFGINAYYDGNSRGTYTRYLEIRDGSGAVKCTTNTVYTTVY